MNCVTLLSVLGAARSAAGTATPDSKTVILGALLGVLGAAGMATPVKQVFPLDAAGMSTPKTVTVYHVNPLRSGVIPLDMNTADLHGEIFFDLRSAINPIECAPNETRGFRADCENPEVGLGLVARVLWLYCMRLASLGVGGV